MTILWLKMVHIAALVVWCAALFALPVLLAAYPLNTRAAETHLVRAKARFGFIAIASPAAVVAIISGTALIYAAQAIGGWLFLKLTAVALLVAFHVACGGLVFRLHERPRMWPPAAHLALAIVPAVLTPTIFWLVLSKPL